jgi:hypothetical protein
VYSDIFLCKLSAPSTKIEQINIIAKFGKERDSLKHEFEVMRTLWDEHFYKEKIFSIPKPIHFSKDDNIFFMDQVPGKPLAIILRFNAAFLGRKIYRDRITEFIKRAAEWLRIFHNYTRKQKKIYYESGLELDIKNLGELSFANLEDEIVSRCIKKLQKQVNNTDIAPHYQTGRHGDYYDENVLIAAAPKTTTVIDFAQFSYGLPLFDVVKFIVGLEIYSSFRSYNSKFFTGLIDTFLNTYNESNEVVTYSSQAVSTYKPIILLHELLWCEYSEKNYPTKNPFIKFSINSIKDYSISEIKRFVNE